MIKRAQWFLMSRPIAMRRYFDLSTCERPGAVIFLNAVEYVLLSGFLGMELHDNIFPASYRVKLSY